LQLERSPMVGIEKPAAANTAVRSILLIRFQRLGDLVMVLGLAQNLRRAFPAAHLTLMCGEVYAPFFRQQSGIDDTIGVPAKGFSTAKISGWFRTFKAIMSRSFDLVIDVSDNRRSSLLTRLTRAPRRMGFWPPARGSGRRTLLENGAYNCPVPTPDFTDAADHFISQYFAPLQALDVPIHTTRPTLTATPADQARVEHLLDAAKHGSYAVIHPGARVPNRRWPARNFVAVIEHLSKRGLAAVIVGDTSERALADEITRACTVVDLVGRLSLGELTAVIERSSLYIGNNTGPIHIAAAVGARIVAIYGPQPVTDRLWTPLAERLSIVLPTNPCTCLDPATCQPSDPDGSLCVWTIPVSAVVQGIDAQLDCLTAACR
jgi:heptosyltransferase-3